MFVEKGQDRTPGITLSQVTRKGRCIGTVPENKKHLCQITKLVQDTLRPAEWLILAANTKWVCNTLGVTPCISITAFNESHEFCIQVVIVPRIIYHPREYVYSQSHISKHHLQKTRTLYSPHGCSIINHWRS